MSQVKLDLSYHYHSLKNRSRAIQRVIDKAKMAAPEADKLADDVFNALFQAHPNLMQSDDPNNIYQKALRAVLANSNFDKLRSQTRGSLQWSSIGATILVDEIVRSAGSEFLGEKYPEEKEPAQTKPESKPNKSNDTQSDESDDSRSENKQSDSDADMDNSQDDNTESESDELSDNGDESESGDSGDSDNSESELGDEENQEDSQSDKLGENAADNNDASDGSDDSEYEGDLEDGEEDSDSENGDDAEHENDSQTNGGNGQTEQFWGDEPTEEEYSESGSQTLDQAVDKAAERLNDIMGAMQAGKGNKLPTVEDAAHDSDLITRLADNSLVAKILAMVGRLRLNANFMPGFSVGYPQETIGITTGRNLARTLPQDLGLLLGNKQEFGIFLDKYNNSALLNYKSISNNQAGKGPMIVCIDDSGSMSGGRDLWAKSLAVATYMQCVKEKRAFACIVFSDMATLIEPKKQYVLSPEYIEQIINTRMGGGTNFEAAWNRAVEFFRSQSKNSTWRFADICFMTDGQDSFDRDKWEADKKKYQFRLVSILIGQSEKQSIGIWDEAALEERYRGVMRQRVSYLIGTPKNRAIQELYDTSEVMMFIEDLSDAANRDAFNIVNKKKTMVKK